MRTPSAILLLLSLLLDVRVAAFQPAFTSHQQHAASIASSSSSSSSSSSLLNMAPMSFGWTGKPDRFISNIFEANKRWKYGKLAEDHEFFDKLGSGHAPKYLWIGCADARVPANEIMGEDAGSVFVLRNVANMVVNTDFNLMSGLQYAVSVLKVPHIIVCGHYDCGGVRASMQRKDHGPPLENWLRNIRDVYRLHRTELDSIMDPEQRHRRLVELNVIEQCINLFKTGVVQRQRVETFRERSKPADEIDPKALDYTTPRIHACVFDPKTGDLNRLEVDFHEYIEELHTIYDLYTLEEPEVVAERPHAPQPLNADASHQRTRDPNDYFGGNYGVTSATRDSNDAYQSSGTATPGVRNDSYRAINGATNGVNDAYRSRNGNDAYRRPGAINGVRPAGGSDGYRAYGATDGPVRGRNDDYNRNGASHVSNSVDQRYGGATGGARYAPNGDYDDPYSATDGVRAHQNAYPAYDATVIRKDQNEFYLPPAAATDGAGEFSDEYSPYRAPEVMRDFDDGYGSYPPSGGAMPLNGGPIPYGPNGEAANQRFGTPQERRSQSSATAHPSGNYHDGLKQEPGASNGYPDGRGDGFTY